MWPVASDLDTAGLEILRKSYPLLQILRSSNFEVSISSLFISYYFKKVFMDFFLGGGLVFCLNV